MSDVCLCDVCLVASLRKNYRMDLPENFTTDVLEQERTDEM